ALPTRFRSRVARTDSSATLRVAVPELYNAPAPPARSGEGPRSSVLDASACVQSATRDQARKVEKIRRSRRRTGQRKNCRRARLKSDPRILIEGKPTREGMPAQ